MAADWSQLPTELLRLISNRLNSDLYLLRFRSVCSTWRSSTTFPNPNHHHQKLPILSNSINNPYSRSTTFSLSKRTLFLISPPPQNQTLHPWIIKINNSNNQLLNPLSHFSLVPLYFPHVLDFNDLSVVELGHEFVFGNGDELSSIFNNLFLEKVVLFQIERGFALLTIQVSGKLGVFRLGDDRWTIIPEMAEMPIRYEDVCVFKGKPLAVEDTGRTVRVRVGVGIEPELGLDLVAYPVLFGGDTTYLVESNGELLLLNKQVSRVLDDDDDDDNYGVEWIVKFDVYRLDEKEKRWVELTSLGDRTLFLAENCAFSLSASDLGSCFGNCVIFRDDDAFHGFEFESAVFELGRQKSIPLQKACPNFYDLFTPPKWAWSR